VARDTSSAASWRAVAVAAVAALVALSSGCASIPGSGSVHSAAQAEGSGSDTEQDVQFYPEPPADGASAEEIVRGFVDASGAVEPATANQPDFATAREYLASDDPRDWRPASQILVYDGFQTEPQGTDRVNFDATITGRIDSRGTYTPAAGGNTTYHTVFDVPQVKGQPRIENPPLGLLISKSNFDREYESVNLYFFDPSQRFLVPDPIYLPKRADRATLLVRGLLAGPTSWLLRAVVSAFPDDTTLSKRGVRIVGGQAVVDLTGPPGKVSKSQLDHYAAQLVWTLGQLQISSVTVTLDGKPSALTNVDVNKVVAQPSGGAGGLATGPIDAYALRGNLLYMFPSIGTDSPKSPVKVAGPFGGRTKLVDFAVQPGSTSGTTATIAGIDPSRSKLFVAEGVLEPKEVFDGQRLASPTWDRSGRLWVIDQRGGASRILVWDSGRRVRQVSAPEIEAKSLTVDALAVSEDGTRLALVTRDKDGRREAQVAAVASVGETIELSGLRPCTPGLSNAVDVAWRGPAELGPAELVILGTEPNGQPQPYLVGVDGSQLRAQGTVEGPRSVTAAPNMPILVGTGSRVLWEQSGGGSWERVDQNVDEPRYPG
jgi:hypothetical protein